MSRTAQGQDRPSAWRVRLLACLACLIAAAGCTTAGSPTSSSGASGPPAKGGTATFALAAKTEFSWLLPIENALNNEPWAMSVEAALYQPLYTAGDGNSPLIDKQVSIAYPPVWSDNNKTVIIRLKHYLWSDGQPVTSRDVEFFLNLQRANKSKDAWYVPGLMPDDIKSASYPSSDEVVLHLTRSYSQQWFDNNQLTWIFPLPQQTWDKTSLSGKVGNYDLTTSGAKNVFSFLYGQSQKVSTYATNPLWQTVDGPWRLTGYNPTSYETTLTPNKAYSGPTKPHLAKVELLSFTSEAAEIDAVRSGQVTYGYLPANDYGLKGYLQGHGFTVAGWAPEYVNWMELGYTSPVYGPLVRQLYLRQALQHLVNEALYVKSVWHGPAQYTYGPVPNLPGSPYVSPEEKTNPDPYSVSAARSLLEAHGWAPGAGGYMVCKRAGSASGDCGAGITAGRKLDLKMMYSTGSPALETEVSAYQTAAKSAGVQIDLDPQSPTTMFSIGAICPPGPCNWGLLIYSSFEWNYGQSNAYPTSDGGFGTGNFWGGGYSSATANKLLATTRYKSGINYLYAQENYLSRDIAAVWVPTPDTQVSVVKNTLHGWHPQQAFGIPIFGDWYYVK
jgi:peptide/nickel transport system substrate-binding protein